MASNVSFFEQVNRIKDGPKKELPPTTKECQFCLSVIPIMATRCPHCTSELAINRAN